MHKTLRLETSSSGQTRHCTVLQPCKRRRPHGDGLFTPELIESRRVECAPGFARKKSSGKPGTRHVRAGLSGPAHYNWHWTAMILDEWIKTFSSGSLSEKLDIYRSNGGLKGAMRMTWRIDMDIMELNSIDQYSWSGLMYISKPKRRCFPSCRVFLGRKRYANNMPSVESRRRPTHRVYLTSILYFPCRCLCFGFFELYEDSHQYKNSYPEAVCQQRHGVGLTR